MIQARRGETVTLQAGFFEDAAQTVPRVPLDAGQPVYEITDADGSIVVSAAAVPTPGVPGSYDAVYPVPVDAALGPSETPWRIDWAFTDASGATAVYSEGFQVLERQDQLDAIGKRHGYIVYQGKNAVLINYRKTQPSEITVEVSIPGQDPIQTDRQVAGQTPEELQDGTVYAYRDTVAAANLLQDTTYTVMWDITETPTSLPRVETEVLHVLGRIWIPYMHALDVVINKIRARATDLQKPTDYEMFNALKEGLRIVNGWHPNTVQWSMAQFPHSTLGPFVILAAQFWWLNSLYQAEGLLQFNFSGQTVSLDYDHLGWIEASMSRAMDYLNSNLASQKMGVSRRSQAVAAVAVRPIRYGSYRDHHTYKINDSRMSSNTIVDLLVGFGLI